MDITLINNDLENQYQSAVMVSEVMRVLQKSESNIVGEILKYADKFEEWEHVPNDDVYDHESHCQYYYHTHSKSEDGTDLHDDEHGHFHLFIRGKGMPDDMKPAPLNDCEETDISDINTHIIGIGMNEYGTPIRLFTTNRWVTGEVWHEGSDIISLLDQFEIDDSRPNWPVNLWITNMVSLFKPQIIELIQKRDAQIEEWKKQYTDENIFEKRELEVASYLDIDLANRINELEKEIS